MSKEYDLVVFGATGFTGKRIVKRLASIAHGRTWAIAGRNEKKLQAVLAEYDCDDDVATLVADVSDEQSLNEMCRVARCVLNCVGPYRFYGLQVVKAAVENHCHYVDITGEPEFVVKSEVQYGALAQENSVLIVHCCGFDSVPADLGVRYATEVCREEGYECYQTQSYLSLTSNDNAGGFKGHFTTFECAVHGFANVAKLKRARDELKKLTKSDKPVLRIASLKRPAVEPAFAKQQRVFPFPGADAAIVRRSQAVLAARGIESAPQPYYSAFFTVSSFLYTVLLSVFFVLLKLLTPFKCGRYLLLTYEHYTNLDHYNLFPRYPKLFTLGYFSHEGPSDAEMTAAGFRLKFFTEGVRKGERKLFVTSVEGPEAGYVATPIITVECALAILRELNEPKTNRAKRCGVLTPAVAFEGTSLRARLHKGGILFKRCEEEEEEHH